MVCVLTIRNIFSSKSSTFVFSPIFLKAYCYIQTLANTNPLVLKIQKYLFRISLRQNNCLFVGFQVTLMTQVTRVQVSIACSAASLGRITHRSISVTDYDSLITHLLSKTCQEELFSVWCQHNISLHIATQCWRQPWPASSLERHLMLIDEEIYPSLGQRRKVSVTVSHLSTVPNILRPGSRPCPPFLFDRNPSLSDVIESSILPISFCAP